MDTGERPTHLPRLEAGSVFAGYRVERLIDRGGMGVVYEATDPELDRAIALKIIAPEFTQDPTAVARFKAEARIAASLEHPHIVPIHRGGAYDGVLYLAMRYVAGTNLRHAIGDSPMDLARVARIVADVGDALDVAHAHGLVHRDVKPANILLSGNPKREQVYLTDFGLTKRLGSTGDLTRTGAWVGTPDYVAPEQIQGRDVDGRADVYSLGCVLFEMLTGHVAYRKDSDVAKLWAHVADPPPAPRTERPDLVEAFDEVVTRATAKDPDDRYASAGEFAAAVARAVAEQTALDRGATEPGLFDEPLEPTQALGVVTHEEVFIDDRVPRASAAARDEPERPPRAPAPPPAQDDRRWPAPLVPPVAAMRAPYPQTGPDRPWPDQPWLTRHRGAVAAAVAILSCAAALVILLSSRSSTTAPGTTATSSAHQQPEARAGQRISGALSPVPTNRVTGTGNALVRLTGNRATFSLTTNDLVNGPPHALHLHAGGRGQCPPERVAKLHNGNLSIATKSGVPFYGHAMTALTTTGSTDPATSLLAFKRYPLTGNIRYSRTIDVGPVVASYLRENNAVVVVHGIDYNHNGIYDGSLDRSDLNRTLPGEATAPALCGVLTAQRTSGSSGTTDRGSKTGRVPQSRTVVFAATFAGASDPPATPAWQCSLGRQPGARLS